MNFFRRTPRAVGAPEFLIVGLGNPGKEYEFTRHNAGFLCLDLFAQENDIKINRLKFNALIGDAEIGGKRCILAKPQTFMNNSGEAVISVSIIITLSLRRRHPAFSVRSNTARLYPPGGGVFR